MSKPPKIWGGTTSPVTHRLLYPVVCAHFFSYHHHHRRVIVVVIIIIVINLVSQRILISMKFQYEIFIQIGYFLSASLYVSKRGAY